jgi:hypothetical protein
VDEFASMLSVEGGAITIDHFAVDIEVHSVLSMMVKSQLSQKELILILLWWMFMVCHWKTT